MTLALLLGSSLPAAGGGLAFPALPEDHPAFYPTGYVDHAGEDWNCGGFTYPGHQGSDFGAGGFAGMDEGRTVSAAASGVVVATNDGELDRCVTGTCSGGAGYGNFVVVEHEDGKRTLYAHLAQWSVAVAVGDPVTCGQALGRVGSSGYSTGPHLHFEVRDGDDAVQDPFAGACGPSDSHWSDQGGYEDVPAPACGVLPTCEPQAALSCGQQVFAANDDPGSTASTWRYGCTEWVYTGPELSFVFTAAVSETVRLTLGGLTADLDLYVLDAPDCDGTGCIASGSSPSVEPEDLTFEAEEGRTYVVVVDGWEGATSPFALTIDCVGDPGDPPATGDTAGTVEPGPPLQPPPGAGCGCAASPVSGLGVTGLLGSLVLLRRRGHRASARRAA